MCHSGFQNSFNTCTVQMYSTANDPQPQMIPRPQMIPKMDRKWSSTASDPQSWPQMIPRKLEEWNGFYGTDYKKGPIIKKETFFSRLLKKKGKRMLHLRSIFVAEKFKTGRTLRRKNSIILTARSPTCIVYWGIQCRVPSTEHIALLTLLISLEVWN